MAGRSSSGSLRGLSRAEKIAGWLYLPVYFFLLAYAMQLLPKLGVEAAPLVKTCIFYGVNFLAVLLIFRRFLRQPFFGDGFWDLVQALVLGAVFYFVLNFLLDRALSLLKLSATAYNNDTVNALLDQSRTVMLLISVAAAPIIEETLLRGLVFGTIRHTSRVFAYAVSTFLFAFMHTWQFYPAHSVGELALAALLYVPAGVCLAWTYEKSGTIWGSILLHAGINAFACLQNLSGGILHG